MITFYRYKHFQKFSTFSHTHQLYHETNSIQRKLYFQNNYYNIDTQSLKGHCTSQSSLKYSLRNPDIPHDNWKSPIQSDLKISSIGVGTYTGQINHQDDLKMFNAIIDSILTNSVNVIDTCSSFRYSKSQRVINTALRYLVNQKKYSRQQLFIITKQGYIIEDADFKIDQSTILNKLFSQKLIETTDVINNHCVHPNYLEYLLNRSLIKLGLQTIDLLMLNNFAENQLPSLKKEQFQYRLQKVFQFYQKMIQQKKINNYGLASWASFRVSKNQKNHLNLQNIVKLAQKIGGKKHGLRYIEMPINIIMPEAFSQTYQDWENQNTKQNQNLTILSAAHRANINIISCSPLMNGTLINIPLPSEQMKCNYNGAKHLQFIRSIPASSMLCTLIGHKRNRHVKTNLEVTTVPKLTKEQFLNFLRPSVRIPLFEKPKP